MYIYIQWSSLCITIANTVKILLIEHTNHAFLKWINCMMILAQTSFSNLLLAGSLCEAVFYLVTKNIHN